MRRLTTLAVLALGASCLIAQGPPPHEKSPEGFLADSLGWNKVEKMTGIRWYYYFQEGISTNNTIKKGVSGDYTGDANGPLPAPTDVDTPTFEQLEQFIEKETKSNMVIGVTPTPAPMAKKFDWGFLSDTLYGRQAQGCRMTGFDMNWSMNPSFNPGSDSTERNMWLCEPNLYADFYIPVLKGVSLRLGRQADQLMIDEIPPNMLHSPNFFYSHTYGFYRVTQVFGGRVTANIIHDHKLGYLMGEFYVDNGLGTVYSMSRSLDYDYALRYRSPDMSLWIDYTGRVGDGNVKTGSTSNILATGDPLAKMEWVGDNFTSYHLFSPKGQILFENALLVSKEFRPKWKALAQIQFGKQYGDGAANTIFGFNPGFLVSGGNSEYASFKGASFHSFEGMGIYTFNKKLSGALRMEVFRNPQGFFTPMSMSGISGTISDFTAGVNFQPSKYVRLRPELRYDWQSGKYGGFNGYHTGAKAFGAVSSLDAHGNAVIGNPSDTQFTASMDAVFYF